MVGRRGKATSGQRTGVVVRKQENFKSQFTFTDMNYIT